jgi:hypothetical protein
MDLWQTLGISRETGIIAACVGLAFATIMGLVRVWRHSHGERIVGVRLTGRD